MRCAKTGVRSPFPIAKTVGLVSQVVGLKADPQGLAARVGLVSRVGGLTADGVAALSA